MREDIAVSIFPVSPRATTRLSKHPHATLDSSGTTEEAERDNMLYMRLNEVEGLMFTLLIN